MTLHPWMVLVEGAVVGAVGALISARVHVAVLNNDMTWVKDNIRAIWRRLDKVEEL